MKKNFLFIFFIIFYFSKLFSFSIFDTYRFIYPDFDIVLDKSLSGKIIDCDGNEIHRFTFVHESINKTQFINQITSPIEIKTNEYMSIEFQELVDSILLLAGKELRNNEWRNFAIGFSKRQMPIIDNLPMSFESMDRYKDCTSYLTEGTKEYKMATLSEITIDLPWVEGVPGNGEGEGFTIVGHDSYLLLLNGFISVDKPYLYEQNSRVKELKITGSKSQKSKIISFIDTPNPQTADISFLEDGDDTIVRIESVYPGSKYQDTCITLCKLYKNKVIPYLGEDENIE